MQMNIFLHTTQKIKTEVDVLNQILEIHDLINRLVVQITVFPDIADKKKRRQSCTLQKER